MALKMIGFDGDDPRVTAIEPDRQRAPPARRRRAHWCRPSMAGPSNSPLPMPARVRLAGCLPSLVISVVLTILLNLGLRACSG
jgi:hypothetical protein